MQRHPNLLNRKSTALVIIDIQERIVQVMNQRDSVINNTVKLIQGFKILKNSIFYTEQYPKGLGRTDPSILQHLVHIEPFEKITFSVCCNTDLMRKLDKTGIKQIILAGMETHVCVLQSALDFKQAGYQVYVPADCVCSRKELDYNTALNRMIQQGVTVTSTEMILFELLQQAGTEEFKSISKIVK